MYRVRLSPRAQRFYAAAERPLARKLARCFRQIENDPRDHPNIRALRGDLAGYWRYRTGDYRVIYRIDDRTHLVNVVLIAHRADVYDE
jgi:mRNA interferase RelE/StbE